MQRHREVRRRALDTYSHAIPAMQEEAAERIAGLVLAREPGPVSS